MNRDDLIHTNARIVKTVVERIREGSPEAILIIVSNPLDVMTYQAHLSSGWDRTRVIGMAGVLDAARYKAFLAAELNVSPKEIQTLLLGGHGDTMVPLPRYTTVGGIPIHEFLEADRLDAIAQRTKVGGGELTKLLGTSAWYAPGGAAAQMVEAILRNQRRIFAACVRLEGEYGIDNCYLGVPVILGRQGVQKIISLQLQPEEQELLEISAEHVKDVMKARDRTEKEQGL